MHVRVIIHVPADRVQHGREADRVRSAELRIGQYLLQGKRSSREHRPVTHVLIVPNKGPQFGWNRERDEEVFARQQLLRLLHTPLAIVRRLTARTMPVASRRVRVMDRVAPVCCTLRATVAGRAEASSSAVGNQLQHATVFGRHAMSIAVDVRGSILRAHVAQREHGRFVRATARNLDCQAPS